MQLLTRRGAIRTVHIGSGYVQRSCGPQPPISRINACQPRQSLACGRADAACYHCAIHREIHYEPVPPNSADGSINPASILSLALDHRGYRQRGRTSMPRIYEHAGSNCRPCNADGAKIDLYDNAVSTTMVFWGRLGFPTSRYRITARGARICTNVAIPPETHFSSFVALRRQPIGSSASPREVSKRPTHQNRR